MASKTETWNKAGRFVSVVVVVCFFLPFFGISCGGMEIVTFSGMDMVGGCKPGGMISEAGGMSGMDSGGGEGGSAKADVPNVERKPLAFVALGAALGVCAVAWAMRGKRQALVATFVLSLVGTGAMVGLYVTISSELKDAAKDGPGGKKSGGDDDDLGAQMGKDLAKEIDIDAGARMGFWLTSLGFIAMGGLTGAALREKNDGSAAAAAAYPPPGAPPPA